MRIGFGYDVHRLTDGRDLIIGGVKIPYEKGLLGHSDADVLIHSIMDAMLGALALGDIGKHFPDNSAEYKNADSTTLLRKVSEIIKEKGYRVSNIDSTICAEAPKLAAHILAMRTRIAEVLEISVDDISVKATTTEGLGFVGTGEGIAAYATCLLEGDQL